MKKIIVLFVVFSFVGCESYFNYSLNYAVHGSATTATVTYLNNAGETVEEEITIPWDKVIFITDNNPIAIKAVNTSGGEIDVRVFFDKRGFWQTYERKISSSSVRISGVIH